MEDLNFVQRVCIWLLPVLFAITLHEIAHGWAAKKLGDSTAERMGRLSLNPLHHIDIVGTLVVPAVLLFMGGFIFGWAKPVPVDFGRLRKPRRDMALVAAAGPFANFLMAVFWALMIRLAVLAHSDFITQSLGLMGEAGIAINLVLMILNLLPLPPLDGGRIAVGLLPPNLGYRLAMVEPYGFLILLILMMTNVLSQILAYPLSAIQQVLNGIAGL